MENIPEDSNMYTFDHFTNNINFLRDKGYSLEVAAQIVCIREQTLVIDSRLHRLTKELKEKLDKIHEEVSLFRVGE